MTDKAYFDEVMKAGNLDPWKHWPRLKHKTVIDPNDVKLDGVGNIIDMPLLPDKWCFGRPETCLRQAHQLARPFKNTWGKKVETETRCGRCPVPTRAACKKVALHRVAANPQMNAALRAWVKECQNNHGGKRVYSGSGAGEKWVAFKKAVAARGRFTSANDCNLEKERDRKQAEQTARWRKTKAKQRDRMRAQGHRERQLPSAQFIENCFAERDDRTAALEVALDDPRLPSRFSKVPVDHRRKTAAITANAWAVREILCEANRPCGPSVVARHLVELGLDEGIALATLKGRMPKDLERAFECERLGVWSPFNPNRDLDGFAIPDDEAADERDQPVNDIEDILKELADLPAITA